MGCDGIKRGCGFFRGYTSLNVALGLHAQQFPPVACCVKDAHNRDAVGAGQVEDQEIVETGDAPLTESGQLLIAWKFGGGVV